MFTSEEEPTRFGFSCLGRRLLAGRYANHLEDLASVFLKKGIYSAFIELHIEQGPILKEEATSIGVVTAIAAPASIKVDFEGNGDHAGAVLMPMRNDAGLAAAELALAVEKFELKSGSIDTVGTVVKPRHLPVTHSKQITPGDRITPTGTIFIPCYEGYNHSLKSEEFASIQDITTRDHLGVVYVELPDVGKTAHKELDLDLLKV
ncbi:unnamed protein product [Fraxinus pennsylvanica]|uniref:Ureidoglycolate hydrolase n=1 Tax=Fraxinus pennsylvanica TaxID=56036 RepID=A0AAD1Z3V0_9LAMI|nr:unnamed protein product [Fraxinus pennsylvanica]